MKKTKTETLLDQYNDMIKQDNIKRNQPTDDEEKSREDYIKETGINYITPIAKRSPESDNLKRFIEENKGSVGQRIGIKLTNKI